MLASDCFAVGTRMNPNFALAVAWDLDVYLVRPRVVSLGPAASIAVLGTASGGRQQDLLVTVDAVRVKVGPSLMSGALRPFAFAGGGFAYARLPAQTLADVTVTPTQPGALPVTGTQMFPAIDTFAGVISVGSGADWFSNGPLGVSSTFATHLRIGGSERLPEVWLEFTVGVRFGL